jgi:threonine synthase
MPALDPAVLAPGPMGYAELAYRVSSPFFPGFPQARFRAALADSASRFETAEVAPLVEAGGLHFLELYRGPTLAFKDLALTLLGEMLGMSSELAGDDAGILVLVATSGDTGKAALEGICPEGRSRPPAPGRRLPRIAVFYPSEGVSAVQRLQMTSHAGLSARVFGIRGNFDDAQRAVKAAFAEAGKPGKELQRALAETKTRLCSANSINVARLAPQVAYWVKAWRDLRDRGELGPARLMDVAVPTGNFGDILAAWYAKRMGLPIGRLLCASNRNKVLCDFFETGLYDARRPFYATSSPSMDILVSSNLERLVFHATGDDPRRTAFLMRSLADTGRFELSAAERSKVADFSAGWSDEAEADRAARRLYEESGYLVDPHTAVAASAMARAAPTGRPVVVAATASPFKFPAAVARAIGLEAGAAAGGGAAAELDLAERLAEAARVPLPAAVRALRGKRAVHGEVIDPGDIGAAVLASIGPAGGRAR